MHDGMVVRNGVSVQREMTCRTAFSLGSSLSLSLLLLHLELQDLHDTLHVVLLPLYRLLQRF